MKQWIKDILISFLMGLVMPALVLNFAAAIWDRAQEAPMQAQREGYETVSLPVNLRKADGTVVQEDMDTYLMGVVLAEMPASFEGEALRAQSVVARTYARKAWVTGGKHGDGSVCTKPSCCQAWMSQEDYLQTGGTPENVEKIQNAVRSTSGQILTYQGQPIEATYFSCSGGRTEDAAAVWGRDFPYLRAVDSPGEENAAHYQDMVTFSPSELEKRLAVSFSSDPKNWIGPVTYTQGGGVDTVVIGGKTFTGGEVRSLLGLYSTAFTIAADSDWITITTKGFGHRVGMSQYGADAMAATGKTYPEILAWYYPGTELEQLGNWENNWRAEEMNVA